MEPLTAFGLSLTILNIFLNTLDQMQDRAREVIKLKQKLEEYQLILVACETIFDICFRLWSKHRTNSREIQHQLLQLKS